MEANLSKSILEGTDTLFAIVAHTSLLGIGISRLSDGCIVAVNDAFLSLFGYSRDEVIGRSTLELGMWPVPEDRVQLIERAIQARDGGKNYESSFRKKNGEIGQLLISAHVAEIAGEAHLIGMLSDITGIKRAETALRESERRYRSVVQGQTELICRFQADNTMIFVNDVFCRFFGRPAEEIIGHKWHPLPHPDDVAHIQEKLAQLSPDKPVVVIENRVFDADHAERWMQFVNSAFFDDRGCIAEIQSVGRDITAQKTAEIALQRMKNELEERVIDRTRQLQMLASKVVLQEEEIRQGLARDLHDDLGQLLHLSRIKLDSLRKFLTASGGSERVEELSDIMEKASERVRNMTAELAPPVLERLGIVPAIHWLVEQMERHYGLIIDVDLNGPEAPIDRVSSIMVYRAARELLINVQKHAQTAYASIQMTYETNRFVMIIADEGVGMGQGREEGPEIQGLGLFSIREQVNHLGGKFELTTSAEKGTSVKIELPIALRTLA